ncbi:urease accessory protein UreE [Halohasta litorea]|uniref:Urease accessory protein UreE n=1 Tax=Halohasta litorea TaxID=869891 RepID=A0ABD6D6L8_9EURY|nr:urease accessory protein UreE [Halohasta litorea]
MKRVDGVVGNRFDDPTLAERVEAHEAAGTLERVVLESSNRRKSRLRVATDAGTDLGVLVDQPELSAGDVLVVEDDFAVVVEFEAREAFVIDLLEPTDATLLAAVELGHRIGNQHWDIAVEDGTVYIPVAADKAIIEDVLGPYLPEGTETCYEVVDADRFINSDQPVEYGRDSDRGHSHESDHDHSHESDHDHSHESDHDHSHPGGHSHD